MNNISNFKKGLLQTESTLILRHVWVQVLRPITPSHPVNFISMSVLPRLLYHAVCVLDIRIWLICSLSYHTCINLISYSRLRKKMYILNSMYKLCHRTMSNYNFNNQNLNLKRTYNILKEN